MCGPLAIRPTLSKSIWTNNFDKHHLLRITSRAILGDDRIAVVQSAESWQGDDLVSIWQHRCPDSPNGRVLPQSEMSPGFVVIVDVVVHRPSQVTLFQNDHVIEQVVLPRTLEGGSDRFRAVLFDERDDISGELSGVSPLMYWRRVEHAFRRALWAAISDRRFSA
jgi:hypothetical protein